MVNGTGWDLIEEVAVKCQIVNEAAEAIWNLFSCLLGECNIQPSWLDCRRINPHFPYWPVCSKFLLCFSCIFFSVIMEKCHSDCNCSAAMWAVSYMPISML